ncbi:MAG TPA: phosphoribosylformylglycinamidine cyclo-ligase [Actinomycetota bacterium]|nr:phosphoribosylformylglycinamidine cyclo-ligase [Actinomycetota bacterium]
MSDAYRAAGVDTEAAAKAVSLIADLAAGTRRPEVADVVGGFAGLFSIGQGKLLAAATDGVGTKLEIARATGRRSTVGIDLVAMCADDVVCTGAEPLFFLDYIAVGRVVPEHVAELVAGVAEGCRRAGCALLGGETAEHPGVMPGDQFDLAGFCVGTVDETNVLGPSRVRDGDVLIGLPSSGLHANGYSLVRRVLLDGRSLDTPLSELGRSLADELLEPCAIHTPEVLTMHRDGLVHAAAHITGGGIVENLARILPEGLGARLDRGAWTEQPIFGLLQRQAGLTDDDLFATFNMGLGMILAVAPEHAEPAAAHGPVVGRIEPGSGVTIR